MQRRWNQYQLGQLNRNSLTLTINNTITASLTRISSGRTINKEIMDLPKDTGIMVMGITDTDIMEMDIIGKAVSMEDIIEGIMDMKISLIHRVKEDIIKIKCNISKTTKITNIRHLHRHL